MLKGIAVLGGSSKVTNAIAHELRKRIVPVLAHLLEVVVLESAVVTLMEANQNRHLFTQAPWPTALAGSLDHY